MGKDLEGRGRGPLEILHFYGGAEENREEPLSG
jgi:hypothetical protein